ncbi:MAG: hypothetical protein M3P18_18575 [Actinomycetota bacterium]|nr:hypothetical protein [Actinomycetota bacterium]
MTCVPSAGFTITGIVDEQSGADALWLRRGFRPAEFRRELGPSGEGSIESFVDRFIGGWFEMFPTTGYPGLVPGPLGRVQSLLHGEVMRLPWVVTSRGSNFIEAVVDTIRSPFDVMRRLEILDSQLIVTEQIKNRSSVAAPYVWGHHPCFSRETFAGGRMTLDVLSAEVPNPPFDPANNSLLPGAAFTFPLAPTATGGARDVAAIPDQADGRHEHAAVELRRGELRITAPRFGQAFSLEWRVEDFPYALLWQDYCAEGVALWGACDTFAVEPSTGPGRSVDDAVAAGAVRHLEPGAQLSTELRAGWRSLRGEQDTADARG